jgi:hypothetical protein
MVNRSGGPDTSYDGVFFREYPSFGVVIRRNQEYGGQIARADVFCERVLNRVNGECHRERVTRRGRYSTKVRGLATDVASARQALRAKMHHDGSGCRSQKKA